MDRHAIAAVSIVGTSFDLLGGMYLAYDLLGASTWPLRTLTRGVTYAALFGLACKMGLGWRFGLAVGLTHGFTLAVEFSRAARQRPEFSLLLDTGLNLVRALGYGVGLFYYNNHSLGLRFALLFVVLSPAGQVVAYSRGMSPATKSGRGPARLSRRQLIGVVNRTVGYVAAGCYAGSPPMAPTGWDLP